MSEGNDKSSPAYWDFRAASVKDEHELVYNSAAHFGKNDSIARLLIREFVKKDMRVLDIGCGYGRFYEEIVRAGGEYTGIDFSKEMIRRAQHKYPQGNFIEERWGKHEQLYDVVFECICLSSFSGDKEEFKSEMQKHINVNGICIMVEPIEISVWSIERNLFV